MTEILFATQTALNSATANITTLQSYFTTGVANVANGGTGVSTKTGTGSVVLSTSPTITTPTLTFGTGSSSQVQVESTNTGFQNYFSVANFGTASTSGTVASIYANLGSTDYVHLDAVGGATPTATLGTGAGLTGGMNISTAAGGIVIAPANGIITLTGDGEIQTLAGQSTTAGGFSNPGVTFGSAGIGIYFGSGAPTISAPQGSLYLRTDGSSTSTRMYVNTNGSTTWTNLVTAA